MIDRPDKYRRKFERERAARVEAERLLERISEELYQSLLETKDSQDMLQSAMSSMADGFLLLNANDEIIVANEQIRKIYSNRQHIFETGKSIVEGFQELVSHPDYITVKSGSKPEAYFEIEYADETIVSVSIASTPEGHLASTHRDITALKKSEVEKRDLLIDLMRSQRMEAIGRMSGMIAHDFNNIIAAIQGFAGFLQEDLPEDPALHDMVHRIISATSRAQDLIKQILEYGNQQQASVHQVSLIPVIDDCVEMLLPTLETRIDVDVDAPEKPTWIEGNESRLGQLFTNLLTNSARAIKEDSGSIKVTVEVFEGLDLNQYHPAGSEIDPEINYAIAVLGNLNYSGNCVVVNVIDTGCGMTQTECDRIFEMYFTTRENAIHGGVGMSSVAEVVTEYEGGIKVSSKKGSGTAVTVVFPLLNKPQFASNQAVLDSKATTTHVLDVLLIDDDTSVGDMAKTMLERSGISVEYLSSSKQAVDHISENPSRWKLIISDQIMPDLKGTDLYLEIRNREINLPFIICSGKIDTESEMVIRALKIDVIPKPIDKQFMLEKIQPYL
ncbi:MAG: response regulator [Acidiferrobacterales bacterium]|nr:response regulator [Acidiferrobacterales bacterium]